MATRFKNKLLEKVVKPHTNRNWGTIKATVVDFDKVRYRAKVSFQDYKNNGEMILDKVPINLGGVGLQTVALEKGQQVWISFVNNSPMMPKIIAVADSSYEIRTREKLRHLKQGTLLKLSNQTFEKPKSLTSIIDKENTDISKHYDFISFDLEEKISDFSKNLGYYDGKDIGITNPYNNSTIKILENGAIDIFGKNNHGIRVDVKNDKVYIKSLSNLEISANKIIVNGKELIV